MIERVKEYMRKMTEHSFQGTEIGKVLDDILNVSGKMFRSKLLLFSASLGSETQKKKEKLCKLAAMVELTHLASLIHDDIIDDSVYRRGKISIQSKYGKDIAVYAGDFLMARIYYFGAKERFNESAAVLSKATEAMCLGEIGQDIYRYDETMSTEKYFENIEGKTASLFEAACRIGATEAGCSSDVVETLSLFGKNLGFMFQMKDDLLDFTSDIKILGKQTHQDFRKGIYTFPILHCLKQEKAKKILFPLMRENKKRALSDFEIANMENCVIQYGGIEAGYAEIRRFAKINRKILKEFNKETEFVSSMYDMMAYLEG